MAEQIDSTTLEAFAPASRFRIRISIARQSKGYVHETTIEAEWHGNDWAMLPGSELEGTEAAPIRYILKEMNRQADDAAREEIARREALDAEKAAVTP